MKLGNRIRHYREGLKLTLEQLAERSDVDVGTISALENRGSERSKYAVQIARGLGLTLDQLLDGSTDHLPRLLRAELTRRNSSRGGTAIAAQEPEAIYQGWPFPNVNARAFFTELTEAQRAQVEGFILGLIASSKHLLAAQR